MSALTSAYDTRYDRYMDCWIATCSTSFTYICVVVIDQFGTLQTMPTVASSIQVNSLQFPRTILANGYELSETQLYLLHMCG